MSRIIATTAKYTFYGGLLATSLWTAAVYHQSSKVDRRYIFSSGDVSKSFLDSPAHRLVNPRRVNHTGDSRSVKLYVSPGGTVPQDRVVVWMLNGFFRSWVFAPEAFVLRNVVRVTGRNFTSFSGLRRQLPPPIWYTTQLPNTSLPPLHTLLFSAFQIIDTSHSTPDENETAVDFAFGSDKGTFTGFHRLSVAKVDEDGESYVRLTLACVTCNPTGDGRKPWVETFSFMSTFHKIYAEVLFRAAVGNVVSNLEASGARVRFVPDEE